MPLYIRDDTIDRLTEEVMHATGAKNKTEAVRMALQAQLKAARAKVPLLEAVNEMRAVADDIGAADPAFDQKAFADAQWENT